MRALVLCLSLLALAACEGSRDRTPTAPAGRADGGTPSGADAGGVVPTACTTGADCAQGVCDRSAGRCVACRTSDECDMNSRCERGECVISEPCSGDLDCTPNGRVCDPGKGRCVACNSAADCGEGPCLGHACSGNIACTSSLECAEQRMVCGDAPPPAWPESYGGRGCVECVGAGDCASGEACRDGLCVDVCAGRVCGTVDGASCGECPGQAYCSAQGRACLGLVPAQFAAEQALAAEDKVYVWRDGRNFGAATLWSVDLPAGGTNLRFSSQDGAYLDGVAVAGGRVFAALTSGRIVSGGDTGILSTFAQVPGVGQSDSVWCQGLAGHAAFVVCDLVDYDSAVTSGLYRFPVDGQAPALVDRTVVQPSGFFVAGEEIVRSAFNDGQVGKTGLLSGQRTVLDRVQADLRAVAHGYAYYQTTDDQLRRIPVAGGAAEILLDGDRRWRLLGVGASKLYLLQAGGRALELVEADLDGTNPQTVFEVPSGETPIDAEAVLAAHEHGGRIYVIAQNGILFVER